MYTENDSLVSLSKEKGVFMRYIVYLWYIIKHKWFVMLECFKRGLIWQGLIHDNSKFHPTEFFHYAKTFYDEKGRKRNLRDANGAYNAAQVLGMAWMHHYTRNPHHWQYWVMVEEKYPIRIFKVGNIVEPPVSADVLNKTANILKTYVEMTKAIMENPKLLQDKTPDPLMGIPHIDYEKFMAMGRTVIEMPKKYVVEMLCDWIGAAKAQGGKPNPRGFWEANKDKMELHTNTIKLIEETIKEYEEVLREKVSIEFHINDDAAKKVAKAAKVSASAIVGLVKGHGANVKVEDSKTETKTKK